MFPAMAFQHHKQDSDSCHDWAITLKPVGLNYFGGIVDDASYLLELHSRSTMCTFGTRTSTNCKNRQLAEPSNENQPSVIDCKKRQLTEPDENQAPVSDSAAWQASTRVFWSHTIEGQCVAFDGVPFIVSATKKTTLPIWQTLLQRADCNFRTNTSSRHSQNRLSSTCSCA